MLVAMLALFLALVGPAPAITSVSHYPFWRSIDIIDGSLTGIDIKNHSLTPVDFRGSVRGPRGLRGPAGRTGSVGPQGPKGDAGAVGAQGAQGAKGDAGAQGATGPAGPVALTYVVSAGINNPNGTQTSGTVDCPAGTSVTGGGVINNSTSTGATVNSSAPRDGSDADTIRDDGWLAFVNNTSGADQLFFVYAICTTPTTVSAAAGPSGSGARSQ